MNSLYDFGLFLKKRAEWTNRFIERSFAFRLGIMEETITDMHLFSVADEYSDNVIVRKFNRREEGAVSGADWLWIIGAPGSWLPLLVQAKIVNPETRVCRFLDYNKGEQRRHLVQFARQHSFIPVYCIYSYIPPLATFRKRIIDIQDTQDWACSFVSPKTVRMLSKSGKKSQEDILAHGIPWMDPFLLLADNQSFSGETIARSFVAIRDHSLAFEKTNDSITRENALKSKSSLEKRISWENLDAIHAVQSCIPNQVCKWLTDRNYSKKVPLSGASIISSVPIKKINELKSIQ